MNSTIRLAKYNLYRGVFKFETYLGILYPKAKEFRASLDVFEN